MRVFGSRKWRAGFMYLERLGLFSEINQVVEFLCERYLRDAMSVSLLEADLLVRNKFLKVVDEFLGALSGLFQDTGEGAGWRCGKGRNGSVDTRRIPT